VLHEFQSESHPDEYAADTTHYSNVASDDPTGDEAVLLSWGQLQMLHVVDTDMYQLKSAPEWSGDSEDTEFLGQKLGTASLGLSLSADQHISLAPVAVFF
jgi:hypothetical protein